MRGAIAWPLRPGSKKPLSSASQILLKGAQKWAHPPLTGIPRKVIMAAASRPEFHGLSAQGHVRTSNEDQFLIAELGKTMLVHQTSLPIEDRTRLSGRRPGYLFLVADGLGAGPAGERASSL